MPHHPDLGHPILRVVALGFDVMPQSLGIARKGYIFATNDFLADLRSPSPFAPQVAMPPCDFDSPNAQRSRFFRSANGKKNLHTYM